MLSKISTKISTLSISGQLEGFVKEIKDRRDKWNFIELSPLKESESKALIHNLFKGKEIPEELMEPLLKKTEGSPLFIEEFVKDLKESKILLEKEETYVSEESEFLLPDSLWALLEASVDRLPVKERQTLRAASVIGRTFWEKILEILVKSKVGKELSSLEQKNYIYEQLPSQMVADREYIFYHGLLRDATYKTLLKSRGKSFTERFCITWKKKSKKEQESQVCISS